MISKERVDGFAQVCVGDNRYREYVKLSIIPAVWLHALFFWKETNPGTDLYWKEKLNFGDILVEDLAPDFFSDGLTMKDILQSYSNIEKNDLENWESFERDFQKARLECPVKFRSKIPNLVRAKSGVENEWFLWFECFSHDFNHDGGLIPLKTENPERVLNAVLNNSEIKNRIFSLCGGDRAEWDYIPRSEIDDSCIVGVLDWNLESMGLDGITIPAERSRTSPAPMADPGAVPAPSLPLVCPEKQTAPVVVPVGAGKTKKRTNLTADKKKEIAEYAGRNREATYKDLAEHFGLSIEQFRKGKPLRLAVDWVRTGDLGRHAAKPEKLFNDED